MRPFQPGIAAKLSKPVRLALGIVTLLPIIIVIAWVPVFLFVIGPNFTMVPYKQSSQAPTLQAGVLFAAFGALFYLVMYGLIALYIIDVFRNDYITSDRKALWAAVLFLGSAIAMPIYWYLYFWRDKSKDVPPPYPPYPPYGQYPPYAQYPPGAPPPYYAPYPPQYPQNPEQAAQPVGTPAPPAPPAQ